MKEPYKKPSIISIENERIEVFPLAIFTTGVKPFKPRPVTKLSRINNNK